MQSSKENPKRKQESDLERKLEKERPGRELTTEHETKLEIDSRPKSGASSLL
jgi:hypothetical protein